MVVALESTERVRGPGLRTMVSGLMGVPMEEALVRAEGYGLVLASNRRLSEALVRSEEWRGISDAFSCWSGTMAAYDKPGQRIGKTIEYTDSETGMRFIFPVPPEHQGKRNIVLIAEHPDAVLVKDGRDRVVQAAYVDAVGMFPSSHEGWFTGDPKYDIPQGCVADCRNPDARYLSRIEKRVGLVARSSWSDDNDGRLIYLGDRPSSSLGAAVEVPPKVSMITTK